MTCDHRGPNAVAIRSEGFDVLFSYATPVAAIGPDGQHYRTATRHSVTTSRHVNAFLGSAAALEMPQEWFDALSVRQ